MAGFATDIADRLAQDTMEVMDASGEDRLYVEVAAVLAAASTTLEEEYLTCIRVRLAERRARDFLKMKTGAMATDPAQAARQTPDS